MTVTLNLPARGQKNWATDPAKGINENLNNLASEVNDLVLSGITADTFYSTNTQSSASNIVLTSLATMQIITMTAAGKSLTFPDVAAEGFDGMTVYVHNAGTNSFDVKANGGTTLYEGLLGGQGAFFNLESDATAAGTWRVFHMMEYDSASTADLGGTALKQAKFQDYSATTYDLGNISGVVSVDYTNGHYQYGTLTGNITSLTINNLPASGEEGVITLEPTQDGTGSRTIALSSAYKTVGGSGVSLSSGAGDIDLVRFETRDAGTTIYAFATKKLS